MGGVHQQRLIKLIPELALLLTPIHCLMHLQKNY